MTHWRPHKPFAKIALLALGLLLIPQGAKTADLQSQAAYSSNIPARLAMKESRVLNTTTANADSPAVLIAKTKKKPCFCRANGQRYQVGTLTCVRKKIARCIMVLNNPNWSLSNTPCPPTKNSPVS